MALGFLAEHGHSKSEWKLPNLIQSSNHFAILAFSIAHIVTVLSLDGSTLCGGINDSFKNLLLPTHFTLSTLAKRIVESWTQQYRISSKSRFTLNATCLVKFNLSANGIICTQRKKLFLKGFKSLNALYKSTKKEMSFITSTFQLRINWLWLCENFQFDFWIGMKNSVLNAFCQTLSSAVWMRDPCFLWHELCCCSVPVRCSFDCP